MKHFEAYDYNMKKLQNICINAFHLITTDIWSAFTS